jgi:hypothetical protein
MATPNLLEKFATKLGQKKKIIDSLFFACIILLGISATILNQGSDSIIVMVVFALSGYTFMWCGVIEMVISCFDINYDYTKTILNRFLAMPNRNSMKDSKFSQWYTSIFFTFFMFGLLIAPFFGFFVWLKAS